MFAISRLWSLSYIQCWLSIVMFQGCPVTRLSGRWSTVSARWCWSATPPWAGRGWTTGWRRSGGAPGCRWCWPTPGTTRCWWRTWQTRVTCARGSAALGGGRPAPWQGRTSTRCSTSASPRPGLRGRSARRRGWPGPAASSCAWARRRGLGLAGVMRIFMKIRRRFATVRQQ